MTTPPTTLLSRTEFLAAFQRRWHIPPDVWAQLGLDVQPCDCGGLPRCEGWVVVALTRQRQGEVNLPGLSLSPGPAEHIGASDST